MSHNRKYSPSPAHSSTDDDDDNERRSFTVESDPNPYRSPVSRARHDHKRSFLHSFTAVLAALCLIALLFFAYLSFYPIHTRALQEPLPPVSHSTDLVDHFAFNNFLRGPPTAHFRDNLLPDAKYITSWISAGWTNDVMTYINLIYLGLITERIPIIPTFIPSHIGGSVPPIEFGKVFDVPRLTALIRSPVLEWHQVKSRNSTEIDELGCWNVFEVVKDDETQPRYSPLTDMLHLDLSYTFVPSWVKVIPRFQHDFHVYFWALAALAFPEQRTENLVPPSQSRVHRVSLPPDEQLLCYDYLYYVCANQPYEFDFDYSPAWRFVGQHMHWTKELRNLADEYIRRTLRVADGEETPPYIGIHVRHGDFKAFCGEHPIEEGCFAPISVISRRVNEVKAELWERKGLNVNHVIMTSDEREPTWWDEVIKLGWYTVDHSQTVELYGDWYPVLIDAVIQASGVGFVGTDRSTMSTLARRRVQSWQDGVVKTVKWGKPDSDDH